MATNFRQTNNTTPIIVMGYANSLHAMGFEIFAKRAKEAGVDGAIIVDLPPEEDAGLRAAFETYDLALIRLATPTTDAERLPKVVEGTKGFVYYVSMTGITAAEVAKDADGVVVGSAIVKTLHEDGPEAALALIESLANATHGE